MSDGGSYKLVLEFADNNLAQVLFGPHNSHLSRVEDRLGVTVRTFGNTVTVSGAEEMVRVAGAVMQALYGRVEAGDDLLTADVDAALRLESGGESAVPDRELVIRTRKRTIAPRSPRQSEYIRLMQDHDLVFALGPAGTGKTYLAVAWAVALKITGKVDRIILSRPAVEAGERLGFLPGDMKEKVDPYLRPLYDGLHDCLPGEQVRKGLENGDIEVAPLAFMRGRTLKDACIILDEAQNTTPMQMKMFLTRLGENSRMIVTGDLTQIDLPPNVTSGLREALAVLADEPKVGRIDFDHRDVVRHDLVTRIVQAYDRHGAVKDDSHRHGAAKETP